VVFLSDNGPALRPLRDNPGLDASAAAPGYQGWKQADDLRERALLVPFAMAWPVAIPRPFRARAYVGVTTDVVATIYDAVGHTPALPLDGESLLPLLAAAAAAEAAEARPEDDVRRRGPARFVTPNAAAALAPDGQTKLVFHARVNTRVAARDGRWYTPCVAHLFDLAADPGLPPPHRPRPEDPPPRSRASATAAAVGDSDCCSCRCNPSEGGMPTRRHQRGRGVHGIVTVSEHDA